MGYWLSLKTKTAFLGRKMRCKKIIFNYDTIVTSRTTYDTNLEELINRAKFVVCTPGCFIGVKIDRQTHRYTDRIAIYILDLKVNAVLINW